MAAEINTSQMSIRWFEIWRISFLRPTIRTFSRIISDPKAGIKWGVIWIAITAFIVWLVGPQRTIWWGLVANNFGLQAASLFVVAGSLAAPILGMLGLLMSAALAHGLARLFNGAGTFRQLVYCWGVMQVPFILFSGLAFYLLPLIFSLIRLLSSSELSFSLMRLALLISSLIALVGLLYLFYAEGVAFSAVEKFGVAKGLGLLILAAVVLGIAGACLSSGLQAAVMNSLRY